MSKNSKSSGSIKFKGPIDEQIANSCPGRSYCPADQCFRNSGNCGDNGTCCMSQDQVNDLLHDLNCPTSPSVTSPQTSLASTDINTLINSCATQLTLQPSDVSFLCQGADTSACFERICQLGCSDPNCPVQLTNMDPQSLSCQTIAEYCDILEPSLLSDPGLNHLCCDIDLESGVTIRSVCGCASNPCKINNAVSQLKAQATNASGVSDASGTTTPSTTSSTSTTTPSTSTTIKQYTLKFKLWYIIPIIILIIIGIYYKNRSSDAFQNVVATPITPSP